MKTEIGEFEPLLRGWDLGSAALGRIRSCQNERYIERVISTFTRRLTLTWPLLLSIIEKHFQLREAGD